MPPATLVPGSQDERRIAARVSAWLRGSRFGLLAVALVVGVASGLGAVAFRYLIGGITWLATGHAEFGQDGYVGSAHLPWLGLGFFVVISALGGALYGPLVYRFAREARGHGVPEVMLAVAENGGRIRPQVSAVKAVASAVCIGVGGSVGREGPIVQIGSAMASTLGQWVRMPENRMRILVACGAGGGIAATFNAPITGVFFGLEIILREMSVDALFAVMLSAMVADAIAIPFLGSAPFLAQFPLGTALHHPQNYLLVAALAVVAALIGLGFSKILYAIEDLCDRLWKGRPEWARPVVGGLLLGVLLLAIPQLYGVGYPVMFKALAGDYALWFLLLLAVGKVLATSLTLGVGGSGGVFAPTLFIGLMVGTAFGVVVDRLFGPVAGDPALYAAIGMAAVFCSAARAPLTSLASIVEMTGDFTLTLPVMLTVGISTALSRGISYGTIYTTKLLRRGQDIERAAPWRAFTDLQACRAMRPLPVPLEIPTRPADVIAAEQPTALPGAVVSIRDPQTVFASEPVPDVLRQLDAYGRDGLPVLSEDGDRILGWITRQSVLRTIAREMRAQHDAAPVAETTTSALRGYRVLEIAIDEDSPHAGKKLGTMIWPTAYTPVSILHANRLREADPTITVNAGDRINVLVPEGEE